MFILAILAVLGLCITDAANAQAYPSKPVRIIVPWSPGGGTDIVARIVAGKLSETTGQSFFIENRSGATGIIGTDLVAKAAPDGYTLTVGASSTFMLSVAIGARLPYDPDRDLTPIVRIGSIPHVLSVNSGISSKTVAELVAIAKAKPGQLAFGSSGNGSTPQLAGEMLKLLAGINLLHVPYKGSGQTLQDAVSGVVHVAFDSLPGQMGYIRAGRLRPLAALTPRRLDALPEVPTIAEAGFPGAEISTWLALYGPGNLPPPIVQRLHAAVSHVVKMPDAKARLDALGLDDGTSESSVEFAASVQAEIAKYAKVAKAAGIKVD